MKLLVTGASGFLGRYVVAEALAKGHKVRAMVRPASEVAHLPWADDAGVQVVRIDLRSPAGLVDAFDGVDVVLHLAAAKEGDLYAQLAGTVVATENLLAAMTEANVKRLVAVSSFALYDYVGRPSWARIDERSPLAPDQEQRDEYCRTKMLQEQLVRRHADRHGWAVTVLRPGVIYGRDNCWCARLGAKLSDRLWLRIGAWAPLPLTYVENCAEAAVIAATDGVSGERVLNVVDDDAPSQRRYMNELRKRMSPKPRVVPVAWTVARLLARSAWLTNRVLFGGRAKLPGILVPARLHARCKPMRYTNQRVKDTLRWRSRYSLAEALDRSFSRQSATAEHQGCERKDGPAKPA